MPADLTKTRGQSNKLRLDIKSYAAGELSRAFWQDGDGRRLESAIAEIATEIVVCGEIQYRNSAIGHYEWRVSRKAQLEEEARRLKAEQERLERERQARREKARVDRLLGEATSLRQANEIRAYVQAVRLATSAGDRSLPTEELETWAAWALQQADRVDPIRSGAFRKPYELAEGRASCEGEEPSPGAAKAIVP